MTSTSIADRAAGCLVGAFVGDALGLGPHRYYNRDELRSVAERGAYDEKDFTRRLDEELLPKLDGEAFADPSGGAVLHVISGGGQNVSQVCLTGALVGAQVGLSGIPPRFISGLAKGQEIVAIAGKVASSITGQTKP
jgi:ADP-ribosylglycohydrolase